MNTSSKEAAADTYSELIIFSGSLPPTKQVNALFSTRLKPQCSSV